MNRTTVKRGIGAVILALIAAALLAFLLKDKAAQRQEVVEISLPGTEGSVNISDQTTRLPTLTTDNSEGGSVIANAGNGSGNDEPNSASGNSTSGASAKGNTASASGSNPDGTIIASANAVGTTASGAAGSASDTANNTAKGIDFSVKPKAASKSGEFLDLDLVNNGNSNSASANASASPSAATAASSTVTNEAETQQTASQASADTDQGIVIASTAPKSNASSANVVQPRLIDEKRSAPIKSASTAKVVTNRKAVKDSTAATSNASSTATKQAKNGYAIQLLATSSLTRANNLKNVMVGEGYPCYVTKTKQNGKTLYRVRIGQYVKKAAAVKAQSAMKRRYKQNTNVNRSAVVAR